jgi:release factor glutamine methyltransferase
MGVMSALAKYKESVESLTQIYSKTEAQAMLRIVFEKVLGVPIHQVLTNINLGIAQWQIEKVDGYLNELKLQKPIQYILGETEFFGITLHVSPSVLIPRPETEELVEWIISNVNDAKYNILDIGTGSGCIAIALAKHLPQCSISALDISSEALKIARLNAQRASVNVSFFEQNILEVNPIIKAEKFDVVVSNPPYIRESEKTQMRANVIDYEPSLALFVPNGNPLLYYDAIIRFCKDNLSKNGQLFFEINEAFGNELIEVFKQYGFVDIELRKDIFGKDRMIKGVLGK